MWTIMSDPQIAFWHPLNSLSTHAVASAVVASALLPPVVKTARQLDEGLLKSLTRSSTGYRITIDRVVVRLDGTLIDNNPATYTYKLSQGVTESAPWTFRTLDQVIAQVGKGPHPTDGTRPLANAYVEVAATDRGYELQLVPAVNLNA